MIWNVLSLWFNYTIICSPLGRDLCNICYINDVVGCTWVCVCMCVCVLTGVHTLKANEADTREKFSHHVAVAKLFSFSKSKWTQRIYFLIEGNIFCWIYHGIFTAILKQILIPSDFCVWVTCVIDKHKFFTIDKTRVVVGLDLSSSQRTHNFHRDCGQAKAERRKMEKLALACFVC